MSDLYFVDSNVWLYRLLDDQRIDLLEREQKRRIATPLTNAEGVVVSNQVINEVSANLLKKASYGEEQIKVLIQSFYNRYLVVELNLAILEQACDLRNQYRFSFWDSLIVASALSAGAKILFSEDMQDGLKVLDRLEVVNPFK